MPAQPLIGIDVVDVARVARDLDRWGPLLARRLAGADERWTAGATEVAACLALKEATIKAAGGRWAGFEWTAIRLEPSVAAPVDDDVVARALEGLSDGTPAVRVTVVLPDDAGERLGHDMPLVGTGTWLRTCDAVIATVVLTTTEMRV